MKTMMTAAAIAAGLGGTAFADGHANDVTLQLQWVTQAQREDICMGDNNSLNYHNHCDHRLALITIVAFFVRYKSIYII